ncbi:MAG: RNA polymerase sigma factor [Pseudomonadota bacterium]
MRIWAERRGFEAVRSGLPKIFPRLWRYSVVLTGSRQRADDLAQSACMRALERADQFTPGTHLDRWVFRLTHRLWITELRKNAVRTGGGLSTVEEADLVDPGPGPEATLLVREVLAAVMKLPEAQRVTVLLVYVEGYKYRDAAAILDVPLGTVMSRLATARAKLAATFRDDGDICDAR